MKSRKYTILVDFVIILQNRLEILSARNYMSTLNQIKEINKYEI
jgi:hypothetical protein